jgi:two-component system cell cycle sensor histidine kinase/response regulator CckA
MTTVLVAEDCDSLRELIAHTLSIHGHVVLLAADGTGVVDAIEQGVRPDLIILDIVMPVMDGNQVIAWLREHVPGCCPVLVISTFPVEAAKSPPIVGFLPKPFSIDELVHKVFYTLMKQESGAEHGKEKESNGGCRSG